MAGDSTSTSPAYSVVASDTDKPARVTFANTTPMTNGGAVMSDVSSEKQDQILANQAAIIANQAKLDEILANQVAIKSNQSKLDQILANQEKILSKLG